MNKVKKKIIIVLSILITIILILLIAIASISKKVKEEELAQTTQEIDTSAAEVKRMDLIKNKKEYLNIKKCLSKYISEINTKKSSYYGRDENNNYTIIVDDETISNTIYNLISKEYINKKNITIDNVSEFVYKIDEKCFYVPIEIYIKYTSDNIKSYGIYGAILTLEYKPVQESYLILNIDEANKTFSVEQLNSLEEIQNTKINSVDNILQKDNNTYSEIAGIINEEVIKEYIDSYKNLTLAYPEIVYNYYIEDEYKQKRFKTLEEYKKYVNDNKDYIQSINLKEYAIVEDTKDIQYIAIDQKGKNYIFYINSIFDYKILLDNYTVDIPYFIERYNKANSIEKGGYNIQKCIEAINNKDYSYVYNKLYDIFKNNNYETEESFIKEIQKNLFEKNKIETYSVKNEGNIYIYDLLIKDEKNSNNQKNMKFVMQLKEGTDFEISFSF